MYALTRKIEKPKHQACLRPLLVGQSVVVACRQGRAVAPKGRVVEKQVSAFPCAGQVARGAPARLRRLDSACTLPRPRACAWGLGVCLLSSYFPLLTPRETGNRHANAGCCWWRVRDGFWVKLGVAPRAPHADNDVAHQGVDGPIFYHTLTEPTWALCITPGLAGTKLCPGRRDPSCRGHSVHPRLLGPLSRLGDRCWIERAHLREGLPEGLHHHLAVILALWSL